MDEGFSGSEFDSGAADFSGGEFDSGDMDFTADDYADDFLETDDGFEDLSGDDGLEDLSGDDFADDFFEQDDGMDLQTDDVPDEVTADDFADDFFEQDDGMDLPADDVPDEVTADDLAVDFFEQDDPADLPADDTPDEVTADDLAVDFFEQDDPADVPAGDGSEPTAEELSGLSDDPNGDVSSEQTEAGDGSQEELGEGEEPSPDAGETPDLAGDMSQRIDEISNSDMTNQEKIDALQQMKEELLNADARPSDTPEMPEPPELLDTPEMLDPSESTDKPKTLKLDDTRLLEIGNDGINQQLEALRDDYADKGFTPEEIEDKIAADRWRLQQEYLDETFPGQGLSPNAFNGFNENGAKDRIHEIENSPSLQEELSHLNDLETLEMPGTPEAPEMPEPVDAEEIRNWLKDINPNYDPFDIESPYCNNCGSCAFAVEQKLSGNGDLTATADNIGTIPEMNALTGMEQVPMQPDDIQQYLLDQGPGAHVIVGIDRADGPGHWFNAVCLDDHTVVALDGQSGEILDWPPDYGNVTHWDISMKKENAK